MNNRFVRVGAITLIVLLFGTSAVLAYDRRLSAIIHSLNDQAKDTLLQTAQLRIDYYAQREQEVAAQLAQKNQELETKSGELNQKLTELEKTNQELAVKIKELNTAKSQLSANAAELSKLRNRPPLFVFNVESSSIANVEQKKEDIKQLVTDAYDVIGEIYSKPYLLNSVTITFVDSFSNPNAGAEIIISNSSQGLQLTIRIKDFDKNSFNDVNAILHEIVHSFHGLAVLAPVAYEEGITVAATDIVMTRLISQGKIPSFNPLYIRISSGDYTSTSLTLPRNDTEFYTSLSLDDYYQLAGYGWYQIYKADGNFFKIFNEKIYDAKREGKDITESFVRDTVASSTSATIQGNNINQWLNTKAFALN